MRFGAFLPTYWDDYGASPIHVAIDGGRQGGRGAGLRGGLGQRRGDQPRGGARGTLEGGQVIEPLVTLASLVHLVPRLTLGTAVLVLPQRHPILVAKQAAALHLLSGGRLILGVGIGWRAEEFALLGADFAHRAAATDEAIEVLQTLWREPVARYHGRFHHFDAASMPPHPPDGGPPIWIGGNAPGAIRRAARYGSGWLPYVMRPGRLPLRRGHAAGADARATVPDDRQRVLLPHRRSRTSRRPCGRRPRGCPSAFAGSPDAVAQHLEQYRQAGLEYALCAVRVRGPGRPAAPDAHLRRTGRAAVR